MHAAARHGNLAEILFYLFILQVYTCHVRSCYGNYSRLGLHIYFFKDITCIEG